MNACRCFLPLRFIERDLAGYCASVFSRAREAARGETRNYRGIDRCPIYTPRNAWIIDRLEIWPAIQQHMRALIGPGEKLRRREQARRDAGRAERETWLAENDPRAALGSHRHDPRNMVSTPFRVRQVWSTTILLACLRASTAISACQRPAETVLT